MYNIDEVYKLSKYRLSKAGFNGNISPNDFNLVFPRAEKRYFSQLYKRYLENQSNQDALLPFKTDPSVIAIANDGKYNKPSALLHIDSLRVNSPSGERITRVADDRLASNLSSSYDAPTSDFPIYTEYSSYIQFYPVNIQSAILVYLSDYVPSKWAYTLVSGRPVYDPVNSVQPRWSNDDIDAIIYMIGVDFGLNMRDQMEIQVNDIKAKES